MEGARAKALSEKRIVLNSRHSQQANRPTELEQNEWGCIDKDGARVHQVQISQGFVSHGAAGLVPP